MFVDQAASYIFMLAGEPNLLQVLYIVNQSPDYSIQGLHERLTVFTPFGFSYKVGGNGNL